MNRSKLTFLGAMSIFGTVGIFVKYLPLSSSTIAFFRGVLGVLFLLCVIFFSGKSFDTLSIRNNLLLLCLSGAAIGINWILLFESYRYTTVATATVCYYMAPVFLLLAAPLLAERLTIRKGICIAAALVGLVFVSGMMEGGIPKPSELRGIALGIGAALFYATVMLLNKKLSPISAYDKTVVQLGTAAAILLPYCLLSHSLSLSALNWPQLLLLLVVGIIHTGVAYAMYFGSMRDMPAHTIAIFSYLDPVIAVVLSALLLQEPISVWGIAGTVLILGSALVSELPEKK